MYESGYDKDRYYDLKLQPFREISFCVFDLETTGYSSDNDEIIEIGAVRIFNKKPGAKFNVLVRSVDHIPSHIVKLTRMG